MEEMQQPFFVFGTGRVGSSLIHRLLDAHPRVAITNEARVLDFLHFVSRFGSLERGHRETFAVRQDLELAGIIGPEYLERFREVLHRGVLRIAEEFYRTWFADRDFTHWGEKLPDPRTAIEFQTIFPHTKYIIAVRDPRDAISSSLSYSTRSDLLDSDDWRGWSQMWGYCYRAGLEYLRDRHVVRYEDFAPDPLAAAPELLSFLGLEVAEWDPDHDALREQFLQHGTSRDVSATIGRWRHDLTPEQVRTIESDCGEVMAEFGYPLSGS